MKKNNKTYLLLVVVLAIWGTIGYKILSSLSPDATPSSQQVVASFKPLPVKEKAIFKVVTDYRDPFLGTLPKKKKAASAKKKKPKVAPAPEVPVTYTGLITDNTTDERIFFISINGQQHLMGLGQTIEGITLLSGSPTSIKVRSKNRTRTIQRSE